MLTEQLFDDDLYWEKTLRAVVNNALLLLKFSVQLSQTCCQRLGRVHLVYFTRLAQRRFDDVTIVIVELHSSHTHIRTRMDGWGFVAF